MKMNNSDKILSFLVASFNFLVDDCGLHMTENCVSQYGPLIHFSLDKFRLEVFYDMKERHLQLIKMVLDETGEVTKSFYLSNLLLGLEFSYIMKLIAPSNFDELQMAVPEWIIVLNDHKYQIMYGK